MVVAMDKNRLIGRDGALPWHMPADLKHFKAVTMGKPIVMGRKTYESIGRPLPGRTNIVVTRNPDYAATGCLTSNSLESALESAGNVPEVMNIGGAELFGQALEQTQRIYMTRIDAEFEGDTWFPDFDMAQWQILQSVHHIPDERNPYPYSFITLETRRERQL